MIIPLMTAEIFSMEILGRLLGLILTADGVAEAISPWLVGRMRDANGTYFEGFLALVGVALLGALAVSALPKNRRVA
jgi:cyanate permease